METKHHSWQSELGAIFPERFLYNINGHKGDIATEASQQIKQLLDAKCTALYLYDSWKDDFVLATNLICVQKELRQSLFEDAGLDKYTYETVNKSFTIFNGQDLFKTTYTFPAFLIPLNTGESPLGFIMVAFSGDVNDSDEFYQQLERIASETFNLLSGIGNYSQTKEKANKYELLYRVTRKFHSSINTNDVLAEVIHTLNDVYPQFKCNLLLSQDYNNDEELPIHELIYNDEFANKSSVQAFLTGKIHMETTNTKSHLFAPVKGKQGIYGVLQVTAPNALQFPESDIEFITLLANTAGNALENAQLYQQSRQLIADLQLINKTSHTLNSNLRLSDTTTFMKKQIKESFGAKEIGFILFKDDTYELLEGSTDYFSTDQASPFLKKILPSLQFEKESIFIGDYGSKYPGETVPFDSVMAIPMVQLDQVKGAIIILHPSSYYFSFENFKLIKSLVHHSTLAFVNSMLREQLENLVITDYLSKLYSRKYLDEQLQEHLKVDEQGVFLLIDLDDFKTFNDTYGHDVGDELIIQVATIIKNNIGKQGFAARWGGEELAVYLPQAPMQEGVDTALRLVRLVEKSTKPTITVSIGVAHWSESNKDLAKIIFDRADRSLYEAKRLGKNCIAFVK